MVNFTINNSQPAALDLTDMIRRPLVDSDDQTMSEIMETWLANTLAQPIIGTQPVQIVDDKGAGYNRTDIAQLFTEAIVDADNVVSNTTAVSLMSELALNITEATKLPMEYLFFNQALNKTGLPSVMTNTKSRIIKYTIDDLIDPAREYISYAGKSNSYRDSNNALDQFTVGVLSLFTPKAKAMVFADHEEFDKFTEQVLNTAQFIASTQADAPASLVKLAQEFNKMDISDDIATGINLRADDQGITPDYSFQRVLDYEARTYATDTDQTAKSNDTQQRARELSFSLNEFINPQRLIIVNMANHVNKNAQSIADAWNDITQESNDPIHLASLTNLSKLGATQSAARKMAASMQRQQQRAAAANRRATTESSFSAKPVPPQKAILDIMAVLNKMKNSMRTKNITKVRKSTTNRPPRRVRPGNVVQAPGKITRSSYYPDIHFYADCSGSMSITDYQDTLILIIAVAKKLNCDVYFSSFSHSLSHEILVPTKGKTTKQVFELIAKIPKVTGGTDFSQVWDNINNLKVRQDRLNIMSTDFGYIPRSYPKVEHPKNMVYVPAFDRANQQSWDMVRDCAARFTNAMAAHDPTIDSKLLGMK